MIPYLSTDANRETSSSGILSFQDYIKNCQHLIRSRRSDLQLNTSDAQKIIDANSPFEFKPKTQSSANSRIAVLLIHGLLDSPFSLQDIGRVLQAQGILSRSILLPGHGTSPSDLLLVNHDEWIAEVTYGIESLKEQAEQIFLIGFSTGAALSLYLALENPNIAGLILIAPAIKIKAPVDALLDWHYWLKSFSQHPEWICKEHEIDYVKYRSIPYNAVRQVNALIKRIKALHPVGKLKIPMLMIASREDETVCSDTAIRFFTQFHHPHSQLLLYSSITRPYTDNRIMSRGSAYSALGIKHFSHVSLPFAPHNQHYGQEGDYKYASHLNNKKVVYGAYNEVERQCLNLLQRLHILNYKRRLLTYNPDFDFMCQQIIHFILNTQ